MTQTLEEDRKDAYLEAEMRDIASSKKPKPTTPREGLETLVFQVGITKDGVTFAIEPRSRVWLDKQFPRRRGVTQVYLGAPPHQVAEILQEIPLSARESLLRTLVGIHQGPIHSYEVRVPGEDSLLWKGSL